MSARSSVHLGLALFLLFQGLYGLTASGRVDRMADEFEVYLQVESLWDRGSLAIPQVLPEHFYGRVGLDGQQYAPWGPGSPFLSLPHHALGRGLAWAAGVERGHGRAWDELVAGVTSLSSTTWSALAVVGLFVAALAVGASAGRALLLALLLGGTTFLWTYATIFFGEPQTTALLIWAVAFQLRGQRVAAAATTCVLLLVKSTNVILLPALLAIACWDSLRAEGPLQDRVRAALYAAGPILFVICAAGLIHAEFNSARFGDPMQVGYDWSEFGRPGEPQKPFLLADMPRGVFGFLLSPGKSLFLFAPAVLLAAARLRPFARERPACVVAWVAVFVCPLLFFATFNYWEGGYCPGPRYLLPSVPLLLLPLAWGPPPGKAPLIACVVLGVAVQLLGASVSYMEDQDYNDRSDPNWESNYFVFHDPASPDVPVGRPLNRYNLGYSPLVGYPRLLFKHLASGDPGSGQTGLEYFPLRLLRVARRNPPGALPAALPWVVSVPFALLLGLGLRALRREACAS